MNKIVNLQKMLNPKIIRKILKDPNFIVQVKSQVKQRKKEVKQIQIQIPNNKFSNFNNKY